MGDGSSSVCSILDIPDEILAKIILYFNARKRLALANSCTRFNRLVFGDKELLRDLDFSKNGRLTTAAHIQQYFSNEIPCQLLQKVNIQNVRCMKAGEMLNDSIGRAINLVDINVLGVKFRDITELGNFLAPLIHVKRLSINWPRLTADEFANCSKILQKPFGRLTYLSMEVLAYEQDFLPAVILCQALKELHVVTSSASRSLAGDMACSLRPTILRNLEIIHLRWCSAVKNDLLAMIPSPQEWTDFQLSDGRGDTCFYYEKNFEVCEELRESKLLEKSLNLMNNYPHPPLKCGWILIPECLLEEVIRITHEDVPREFCCLTDSGNSNSQQCLLQIDEAKRLLKDPWYQISFLYFKHQITRDCDAHLVASAFPNLTRLVFTDILINEDVISTPRKKKHFQRRLRRKGSKASEEWDDPMNIDSSFKMLVENTPHMRDLTIRADGSYWQRLRNWDLEALCLIPLWKNLTTLRLARIPINDGKFLINIGRECLQLEKIVLDELSNGKHSCYMSDLRQMLSYCRNLKEFSIDQESKIDAAELFISLSTSFKIRSVRVTTYAHTEPYDSANVISSIEELLHRCPKLTTFVFITQRSSQKQRDGLTLALQRIKSELNRPKLQFQTSYLPNSDCEELNFLNAVHDDALTSFFPGELDGVRFVTRWFTSSMSRITASETTEEQQDPTNLDSSFKMLVGITPRVMDYR